MGVGPYPDSKHVNPNNINAGKVLDPISRKL